MKCDLCEEDIVGQIYRDKIVSFGDINSVCRECHLFLEEYESLGAIASNFWEQYRCNHENLPHICDYSLSQLKEKHKNVISLREKYDPWLIGLLLGAEYYNNVWASRSCSMHLFELMEYVSELDSDTEYCEYYCGSSNYFEFMYFHPDRDLLADFWEAAERDKNAT